MSETRKIAAILVADIVGYTRLAGTDEDRILARLRALRSDLIDPTIAVHHGRVVKRTGDGSLIEFRSVVDAVRCAIELQSGLIERNAGLPPERRIEFRVGIHLGDVVEESDGDLMGDGVNIAARLEGIAEPGSICLSEDAYRQVKGRLDLAVSDLGPAQLKNIADPIRIYSLKVDQSPQPTSAPAASGPEKSGPLRLSLVVLPFANIGGDPEQDYFVDGVTESLTTDLSRISGAFVIGRSTAFTYKGKAVDLKQIGRELNVRYVLEGSVQRAGNRMRVNVQLIEAETGAHLWAERFDKLVADFFDMQDEIVSRLANRLGHELAVAEARRAERAITPDSMDHYFLGQVHFKKGDNSRAPTQSAFPLRPRPRSRSGQCRRIGHARMGRFDRCHTLAFRRPSGTVSLRRGRPRQSPQTEAGNRRRARCIGAIAPTDKSPRRGRRRMRARLGDRPQSPARPRFDRPWENSYRPLRRDRDACARGVADQSARPSSGNVVDDCGKRQAVGRP